MHRERGEGKGERRGKGQENMVRARRQESKRAREQRRGAAPFTMSQAHQAVAR